MLTLAIESSCDETAAAVVENGRRVLSNVIATQVPIHQRYGGVVPEIASRAHLEQIVPVVEQALGDAGVTLDRIDSLAVTRGPGLIGCLLVGVEFAKSLAATRGLPLHAVQHVAGHALSVYIGTETDAWGDPVSEPARHEPYVAMAVSGGHSSLLLVDQDWSIRILGETLDDAVGEAYDKIAKAAGLGYPGGPLVDKLAAEGNPEAYDFPRPMVGKSGCDFSFSGLKTAFAREIERLGGRETLGDRPEVVRDLCASFQAAAVDVLVAKAKLALRENGLRRLAVVGGVACNKGLRAALAKRLPKTQVALPHPAYCTDNAAMIGGAAGLLPFAGGSSLALNATAQLDITAPASAWQH
ncbi:tRNA (adenosine(37)-N6)-threonylcarbamoyltransferase complex transferase subunit TsaD [bacterium]|nr:tRNA (adenosine(37)-N6)-threonylcarbamoyltransferase complex transferase subunit TsaD [bacterium]